MARWGWALGLFGVALLHVNQAYAHDRPRVASTTLCADQFVLMLADRDQIASVSYQVNTSLSFYADRAQGIPQNRASAAELLKQDVDVVIMDEMGDPQLSRVMTKFGIDIIRIPLKYSFEDIEKTTLEIARRFGQGERGERIVADIQKRRHHLEKKNRNIHRPIALYFRPDGGGAGAETFVNTAMVLAGFDNLQTLTGQVGWRGLPLERAIQTPPDIIFVSFFDRMYESVSAAFSRHKVFLSLAEKSHMVSVPGKFWICANPLLINAAEFLDRERERLNVAIKQNTKHRLTVKQDESGL